MAFRILDAAVPSDRDHWVALWNDWPDREVAAHPNYVQLFATKDDRALCATLATEGGCVLFPVLLRPLAAEPWAPLGCDLFDLATPYGYGGAFAWGDAHTSKEFWPKFDHWARSQRVVSCFARLSLFPDQLLPFDGDVTPHALNVVRRLNVPDEELWMDYEHKVRKNVKRARSSGVTVSIHEDGSTLGSFTDIYTETMARRGADEFYRFEPHFFDRLVGELRGQVVVAYASSGGVPVSCELVLVSAKHTYSFLGGSRVASLPLRPNDLLKHELIRWCRDIGKSHLVLGGGYEPQDGIFRYKRSFAPDGVRTFFLGRRTFDEPAVEALVRRRALVEASNGTQWSPRQGWFPPYRG